MERIVFLDTNFVCDKTGNCFFSNLEKLKELSEYVKIIIPDMVIWEREEQIKESYNDKGSNFIKNLFKRKLDDVNIEDEIDRLKSESSFDFEVISLNNPSILYEMKDMALKNVPPFKPTTDAGFKDCYIYFTVLEYIKENPGKEYYFCTNDGDFQKARNSVLNVILIDVRENLEKLVLKIDDYLSEKMISYLRENYGLEGELSFKYLGKNINENFIIHATHSGDLRDFRLEIEDREIIDSTNEDYLFSVGDDLYDLEEGIENLCESGSFARTHLRVKNLDDNINFLLADEMIRIIEAGTTNNQIYWLSGDGDVKEFFGKIFEFVKNDIDDELKEKFIELFG